MPWMQAGERGGHPEEMASFQVHTRMPHGISAVLIIQNFKFLFLTDSLALYLTDSIDGDSILKG